MSTIKGRKDSKGSKGSKGSKSSKGSKDSKSNKDRRVGRRVSSTLVSMLMIAILLVLTTPMAMAREFVEPSSPLPFHDTREGVWYYNSVAWAYANRITTGTSPTTFSPQRTTTRAEFVTFMYRMAGSPRTSGSRVFSDVTPTNWYGPAVEWASTYGLTTGTSPTTFSPHRNVTREQMAVFLQRLAHYWGADHTSQGNINTFPDNTQVSRWARGGMEWATHHNIIMGANNRLMPNDSATRAQVVTVLHRFTTNMLAPGQPPERIPILPGPVLPPADDWADSVARDLRAHGWSVSHSGNTINATTPGGRIDVTIAFGAEARLTNHLIGAVGYYSRAGLWEMLMNYGREDP